MDQIPQILGAVLILIAFAAIQRDVMSPHSRTYLLLNLLGAAILTVVALHERDSGFPDAGGRVDRRLSVGARSDASGPHPNRRPLVLGGILRGRCRRRTRDLT